MSSVPAQSHAALPQEFEELFTHHYQLLYRTSYGITGNRDDAEDVLQSLFVRLLQSGLPPQLKRNPAGYLHRATVNLSLNVLRSRKRTKQVQGVDMLTIPAPPSPEPDAWRERDGFHGQLINAIATLKPRALEILMLHYKHDYSDAQIAALLGTSRGSIAVTLYRIRVRLRTLLRGAGFDRE